MLAALRCQALRGCPQLNGRLVLGEFVPFSSVDVSCLVHMERTENGRTVKDLGNAKISSADAKSVPDIARELRTAATRVRTGRDKVRLARELLHVRTVVVFTQVAPVWHTRISRRARASSACCPRGCCGRSCLYVPCGAAPVPASAALSHCATHHHRPSASWEQSLAWRSRFWA